MKQILVVRKQSRSIIIRVIDKDLKEYSVSHSISIKKFREQIYNKTFDEFYLGLHSYVGRNTEHIKPEVLELIASMVRRSLSPAPNKDSGEKK